jgi:hypothetical protein
MGTQTAEGRVGKTVGLTDYRAGSRSCIFIPASTIIPLLKRYVSCYEFINESRF